MSIVIPTTAHPLRWPTNVPRSQGHEQSSFCTISTTNGHRERKWRSNSDGVQKILHELKLMRATNVVISSNLEAREDGGAKFPRADDGRQQPKNDPAVAVYWALSKRLSDGSRSLVPYCMPCSRWSRIACNLYAVALSIEAMRGMERWGAVSTSQAFAGFAALPPGSGEQFVPPQPIVDWRTILGGAWPDDLEPGELLAIAKARHRKLMQSAHPDVGGSTAGAIELNTAMAAAEQELAPGGE